MGVYFADTHPGCHIWHQSHSAISSCFMLNSFALRHGLSHNGQMNIPSMSKIHGEIKVLKKKL